MKFEFLKLHCLPNLLIFNTQKRRGLKAIFFLVQMMLHALLYIKLNGSFNTAANDSLFLILFSHETRSLGLHHQKIRFNCFNSSFDWELLSSIVNICSILFPFCTSLEGINSNACINSRQQTADSMTLK